MSTEIVEQKKPVTVKSLLESEAVRARINEILGKRASTFATSVIQIAQSNSMLATAEPNSVVAAAMTSATLNLALNNNLGYAYIIPFRERQKNNTYLVKAQFQIGYKGFVQLAMRSGQFKTIHATDVKVGEIESRNRLTGEMDFNFIDDDMERNKAQTIGYIAYFKLLNGFEAYHYMSIEEMNIHAKKFSQTFKKNFGLWKDDFLSMALKTVLKLLLSKKAPLSIDMQTAVKTDQASFNNVEDVGDITYIDTKEGEKEVDPTAQRITEMIEEAETQEDLDFIKNNPLAQNEAYLPMIKAKQKLLNEQSNG